MDKIDFPDIPDVPNTLNPSNVFRNTYVRIGIACLLILVVIRIGILMNRRRRSVRVVYVHEKGTPVSVGGIFRENKTQNSPVFRAMHGISFGCSMHVDSIQRITQGREFDLFSVVARSNDSNKQQSGSDHLKIARVWMNGITNDVHIKAGNAHATLANIPMRTWTHVVAVYTPFKTLELYFDGKLIATVQDPEFPAVKRYNEVPFGFKFDQKATQVALLRDLFYAPKALQARDAHSLFVSSS